MSSMTKNTHAVDNLVAERRLRPIYDWLDGGNNKKALQECEKVLKKTPKLQCARALKALSLHRMGKDAEAGEILDILTEEMPTDEQTLQALTLCCQEMKKLDRVCKLYENAAKVDPANEEIQTQLFMSFVRVGDFKQQQKVAMSLYKHHPKNPYYCWAVMSIILQATRGEAASDSNKTNLLLTLAERMMQKIIQDNKLEAEQELQLYFMILHQLGQYEEILTILDGPLNTKLTSVSLSETKLKYNTLLNKWSEVNLLCKSVLMESMDKWDVWLLYIESVFKLWNENADLGSNEGESVDDSPEKAHEFICRVIESYGTRGPYMARFELYSKLQEKNGSNASDLIGDPISLFVEYFRKFGHKPCYISDLRRYLHFLSVQQRQELALNLSKEIDDAQTLENMQRHICALQMARLCDSETDREALIGDLVERYRSGYELYGSNLLPTDMGPSDPYILLSVHLLNDLAHDLSNSDYLLTALAHINMLLKNSPSNFHAKLLGVRLNHLVGNVIGAQEMYASLDVKHLQLDSLGYVHCLRMPTTGLFSTCANMFESTVNFFATNYKDSCDHLTFSYKFGSFIKLDEFMDFRERLRNSMHYATVELDRIYLGIVMDGYHGNSLLLARELKRDYDVVCANYDMQVYVTWNPDRIEGPPELSPESENFVKSTIWFLKIRAKTLECINLAIEVVQSDDKEKEAKLKSFKKNLDEWKELEEEARKGRCEEGTKKLDIPLPSRLSAYLKVPFLSTISKMLQLFIVSAQDVAQENIIEDLKRDLSELQQSFACSNKQFLPDRRFSLEVIVNCTELISMATMICEMCGELTRKQSSKKTKKKNPGGNETTRILVNLIVNTANAMDEAVGQWHSNIFGDDLVKLMEQFGLRDESKSVKINVADSYSNAVKEIRTVLQSKVKLLSGLV